MCNINDVMGKCTYRKKELIKAIAEREGKLINMYCIHHWRIIWRSYSKLALVGFEPATTEYRLNTDSLTNWAMRPWVQLVLRANFVKLLQFHRLFSNASCYHSLIFIRKNLGKFFQEQESDWSGVFLQIEKM